MSTVIEDPWSEFRNSDGTFKLWLHSWCYVTDQRGVMLGKPWGPLPWVFTVPPDGEFLTSLYHTGYTKKMPASWPQFAPPSDKEMAVWLNGKVYGVVFNNFNDKLLDMFLRQTRKQFVTQQDFYGALNNRHLLYSRNNQRRR